MDDQATKHVKYFINPKSLVTAKEVCQILKISTSQLNRLRKDNLFPQCFTSGTTKNVKTARKKWLYQDIMKYIDNQKEGINKEYPQEFIKTIRESERFDVEKQKRRAEKARNARYGR